MANNETYQPAPEDITLARAMNRLIETGEHAGFTDDSLFKALETYRNSVQLKERAAADPKLWNSIEKEITDGNQLPRKMAHIFSLSTPYMKIAAAFLVAAILSLLYLSLPDSEPEFLAESGANQTEIALDDGSSITLRPYSRVKAEETSQAQVTYRVEGEAYFNVSSDESRTFSVVADDGRVDVLGTRFTVSTWSNNVRVFLEEGSILFSDTGTGESVTLEPGQFSILSNGKPSQPETGNSATFTGWMNNVLNLEQRTLRDIAAELSHHYDIEITIPDEAAEESLSGSIRLDELGQVLDDLELSLGGEFVSTSENSYRYTVNP